MTDVVDSLPESEILQRTQDSLAYLGMSRTGREIWMDRDDMTRHLLVSGSTGSGKTEFLLGLCASTVAAGSGLVFVDGKGDVGNFLKVRAIAERFGRGEDVMLLNLSASAPSRSGGGLASHTLSPFRGMQADGIVQLLSSFMEAPSSTDAMWHARAISLLTAVVGAVHWMVEAGHAAEVTPSLVRKHLALPEVTALLARRDMPSRIRSGLRSYLDALPGYSFEKDAKQSNVTNEQHGYLTMQMTGTFALLCDVFGHVFDAGSSNIDMRDVVLNRRILVVLLPTLGRSVSDASRMGRMILALLDGMMATTLECPVEGEWEDILERRPTNAAFPFLAIFDEATHYMAEDMGKLAGQARSLGFCMVFAVQDLISMIQAGRKAAEAIIANTNTQVFMATNRARNREVEILLPSRAAWENERIHEEERLRARISELTFLVNQASAVGSARSRLVEDLTDAHARAVRVVSENPNFSLHGVLTKLEPGEFVVVRSGQFLRGRSLHVTPSLERGRVRLNRFVPWTIGKDEASAQHDRSTSLAAFRDSLRTGDGMPATALSAHYQGTPFQDAQQSVRSAFAFGHMPVPRPAPKCVRLG